MKTEPLYRHVINHACYIVIFLWTAFSVNAQCPTITDPTPPPICDASGYTFANLSADYATDTGDGIVWYDADTGGSVFNDNELVAEGVYYIDNNSGSCTTPRASITVNFQVEPSGENLDRIYCSSDNATIQTYIDDVLQPSIPSGGSVEVYSDVNLTNLVSPTTNIPSGLTGYFIVFVDNGGCKSQLERSSIGVFGSPDNPTPNDPQEFCLDINPTVANLDPGTTDGFNWYQAIDGFGNPIPPVLALSTPLVDGSTYYVQGNNGSCVSAAIPVAVTIYTPNDPGTSANLDYCDNNIPASDFDLFDELGGTPDANGVWSGPLTTSNGNLGTVNISTLTTPGVYTFTYTVPINGVCLEYTADVVITITETFRSGTIAAANPATFCEKDLLATFDLSTLLDNEEAGGQWTQGTTSTDPVVSSPIDLTSLTPGTHNFTYTQNILPNPCPEESTTVQVVVVQDSEAGNAINQTFCENNLVANSPFDLFDALDGTQNDNGGTWTDSDNNIISNSLDITGFTVSGSPYSFTYTISNGTCEDTETITITVEPAPESGTPVATFPEFCEGTGSSNYDLFDLLTGEDQVGTWIDDDSTGTLTGNTVDLSGLAPATYNFTYDVTAIGSCDDVNVTVSITINPLPNTGTPTAAVFCENDLAANSPLDLFAQLTGEDTGGTWADDDASGALTGSDVDLTSLSIGSFNFTYSITDANGCINSSTVLVTIEDAPESGTANTPVEFCIVNVTVGQTYNLFDLLTDEDQTGTWNDDDASGALSGNTVTLDGLAQGTYNFTYDVDAIGACDDTNVTVSIVINDVAAPSADSPQEFCDTATVSDLVATGNAVQWYDAITGGTVLEQTTALVDGQTYYATQIDATTNCESSVRTAVLVTIYQSPNPGNPNATAILGCNDDNSIDLDTGLDGTQDAGGVWQDTDATGALSGNIFDASGIAAGTYQFTYLVSGSSPCNDDSTIITVTIDEPLNAGTDNILDVCSNNGTTDLFTLIGSADLGGTWSPVLASGTGVFDPLIDAPGTYTYSLTNGCGRFSSEVEVSVEQAPNAGADDSITICVIDGVTDLFLSLGSSAQSGGTWSPALTSGTGEFDPSVDAAGVYTYTVAAVLPCTTDSTAQITVAIDDTPTPTVTNNTPEYCLVDNPTVSDLDTTISSSGTINWYEDAALTIVANPTDSLVDGEDYYATQTNSSGCESSTNVLVTVTINDEPTPTLLSSNQELCINDNPTIAELTTNINFDSSLHSVAWYDANVGGNTVSESTTLTNGTTYYAVLENLATGCESSLRLSVTPDLTSCGDLIIPDGFSPNGDGVNDTFEMNNLGILYPNFEIEIFNRSGNVVYKGKLNTPRFNGKSNQSALGSSDLPVGVYFYIFNFNDGINRPKKGRLYLSR